jgi:SAM-dependent methyltransferase
VAGPAAPERRWNHNLHYHALLLAAVPRGAKRALDVGCGEGTLARRLRRIVPRVTAIDVDEPSLALARAQPGAAEIDYVHGDVMTAPLEPGSFDYVVCVAALHHMDPAEGLARMRDLLRPGGVLAVLGLARGTYPRDLPRELTAAAVSRVVRVRRGEWESPAPTIWPPAHTYGEMRAIAQDVLPGARFRHHLYFRYSIVWSKDAPRGRVTRA